MILQKLIVCLISCNFYFLLLYSQSNPNFSNIQYITSDEGLSQSEVTCIIQDRQGFLWVGTRGGLNRYDGYTFKIFQNEIGNSNSLINNSIESLFEDSKGNIWIGTKSNGISCYNPQKDQFQHYQNQPQNSNSISGNRVLTFAESESGEIWIGTWQNGITVINPEEGTSRFFLNNARIRKIRILKDNSIWVATTGGLISFSSTGELLENISAPLWAQGFIDIIEDRNSGKLYLGTWGSGLVELDRETKIFRKFSHDNNNPQSISSNNAYNLFQDQKGQIWVGTWGGGLNLLHPETGTFTRYDLALLRNSGGTKLYQDVLYCFEDQRGIYWFGTNGGGICKVDESINQFGLTKKSTLGSDLPNEPTTAVLKDKNDILWVGTKGKSEVFYRKEKGSFSVLEIPNLNPNPRLIQRNEVKSLFECRNGDLFLSNNQSLFKIQEGGDSYKISPIKIQEENQNTSRNTRQILVMYETFDGTFWIGTQQNGLKRSIGKGKLEDQVFKVFQKNDAKGSLKSNRVSALHQDKKDRFWVGTYGGLHLYQPDLDNFLHFGKKQGDSTSLSSDIIICLHEDQNGNLWIGTPNGLNLAIQEEDNSWSFTCLQQKDGLPNNYIHAILEDDSGNLWISTNKGISKYNPDTNTFNNYDVNDGLQSNSFRENIAFRDDKGILYFGGIYGLNFFNPDSIKQNITPPSVVLTGFKVFNREVRTNTPFEGRLILDQSIEYAKKISLTHNENVFTIDYTALNFHAPFGNTYEYKMEGLEEEWNSVGNQRSATYTNLKPGTYTFRVKAANNKGVWNEAGARLEIEIQPPFYATWPAFLIYTLIFIGLLLLYRYIISQQNDLKNKLEIAKLEREKELEIAEMKTRFFTNITHELRTPLTLISGPVEELMSKDNLSGKLKDYMITIHHHSQRLLGLVNQLLDFRKAETGNMDLEVAKGNFAHFAHEVFLSFRELAEKNSIDYRFEQSDSEIPLYYDRDKMEIVLCNLLSNAFKYSPANSIISLSLKLIKQNSGENYCEIKVTDNGKGMARELVEKIFDRFYQIANTDSVKLIGTGIGLALAQNIVQLHRGKITVSSTIGEGSEFQIQLPLGKSHFLPGQILDAFRNSEDHSHYREDELIPSILTRSEVSNPLQIDSTNLALLIVEDNSEIRTFIRKIFEEDYHVSEAENGRKALEMVKQKLPDLIISDLMMPEMDGLSFCKKIKENDPTAHIPVVLLTARTSTVFQVEGYDSGADIYVTKPFNPSVLKAQVNSLLIARKKLKESFGKKITLQPTEIEISSRDEEFINKAMKLVEDNLLSEDLNRDFLAEEMAMSPSTLYRKLKALTGFTTNAFIRSLRLKRSAQMMRNTQFNISEIAYQVGFNDLKYFRTCFREQFGMNPSQYLQSQANIPDNPTY